MADKQRENKEDEEMKKKRHISAKDNENLNDMLIQKIAKNERARDKERKLCIQNNNSLLDEFFVHLFFVFLFLLFVIVLLAY